MILTINNENTLQDLQRMFNTQYPFLKIDFYRNHGAPGSRFLQMQKIQSMERTGRLTASTVATGVDIDAHRTVAQVSADFENMLGLPVMILRRSGNVWIETSLTAAWTLEQQNREGEHISLIS